MTHECGESCRHASSCAVHNGPALPEGPCDCFTLVPTEPTREMLIAGFNATALEFDILQCVRKMYAAMLEAAP